MPEEVIYYITKYGYLAIFIMIFLQEIGMPNPLPNELLIIFTGYLSYKGLLTFQYVLLTVVFADFMGTNILFFLFFNSGTYIVSKKPKWVPLSDRIIEKLSVRIGNRGLWALFIFRVTPFTRGYASVIAGLLQIKPKSFLPLAFISATTWASAYLFIGHLLGPSWNKFSENLESFNKFLFVLLLIAVCISGSVLYLRHRLNRKCYKIKMNQSQQIEI